MVVLQPLNNDATITELFRLSGSKKSRSQDELDSFRRAMKVKLEHDMSLYFT